MRLQNLVILSASQSQATQKQDLLQLKRLNNYSENNMIEREQFIKHVVEPRQRYNRNYSEERTKRELSEKLAREVEEFGVEIKVLPMGQSALSKYRISDSLSMAQKEEAKRMRMKAQHELLQAYVDRFGMPRWKDLAEAIGGVDRSQLRKAYEQTLEITVAWSRVQNYLTKALEAAQDEEA